MRNAKCVVRNGGSGASIYIAPQNIMKIQKDSVLFHRAFDEIERYPFIVIYNINMGYWGAS